MAETAFDIDVEIPLGSRTLRVALTTSARRIALVGPSGVGKSTTLAALVGVQPRVTGRIVVGGCVFLDSERKLWTPPERRGVGWVPQDALLFPHVDVRRNVLWRSQVASELPRLAKLLEIGHLLDRRPRNLSGGERQRVALCRALMTRPRLLLLDEPFSALHRDLRTSVANLVLGECDARGIALVLVSHDQGDVASLAEETYPVGGAEGVVAGA